LVTFRKSLFGGTCLAIQPLVLNVLSLPVMAYIIRGLGPASYGQWTMATAMIGVLGVIANLGLRGAFVRQVAGQPHNAPKMLAEQMGLRLVLAIAAAALAILLCLILKYPVVVIECAAVSAVAMIVSTFASTLVDVLQAIGSTATVAAVNLVAGFLLTAASVIVIWVGMGPIALSVAYLIAPVFAAIALLIIVRKEMPVQIRFDRIGGLRLLKHSRAFAAQSLLNSASSYVEALFLPQLIGPANFGLYIAGTLLPLRLTAIPDGFCTAAYPMLTKRFRDCRVRGTWLTMGWLGFILISCLAAALCVYLLAGPIAAVLFPGKQESCRMVIRVTVWALPLFGIESVLGYAINAAGADGAQARASLPAALCNVALTIILMKNLGLTGACIAMPLRHAVRIILLIVCFSRWFSADAESQPIAVAVA
jgi:O-antigen/teichoic acid export membrane protein